MTELPKNPWPLRDVVYIFERVGSHGGGIWWLVLECGHATTRRRTLPNHWTAMANTLFARKLKTAPKRCRCSYCGSGAVSCDPKILIDAFSRSERP